MKTYNEIECESGCSAKGYGIHDRIVCFQLGTLSCSKELVPSIYQATFACESRRVSKSNIDRIDVHMTSTVSVSDLVAGKSDELPEGNKAPCCRTARVGPPMTNWSPGTVGIEPCQDSINHGVCQISGSIAFEINESPR